MHSSYRVIKSVNVCESGTKAIDTDFYIEPAPIVGETIELEDTNPRSMEEYLKLKKKGEEIVENAHKEGEAILANANEKVEEILYEAKEDGFNKGYEEGHSIGYKEGYDKAYDEGVKKGEEIIQNANFILYQAKEEYDKFLKSKEIGIRKIIVNAVENMLKKELESKEALNGLLFNILSEEKNAKMIIIRVAPNYLEEIETKIEEFKHSMGIRGEVVVLQDNYLEYGTLVVEKDDGKTTFTIKGSIEKLKEILMEA